MISELVDVLRNITGKDPRNHRPKSGGRGPSVSPGMISGSVQSGSTFAGPLSELHQPKHDHVRSWLGSQSTSSGNNENPVDKRLVSSIHFFMSFCFENVKYVKSHLEAVTVPKDLLYFDLFA